MNHIKRWRHAMIALDDQDEPVGVIYMSDGHLPYPGIKAPVQGAQSVLDHLAHRKIAQQVMRDNQNGLLAAKRSS